MFETVLILGISGFAFYCHMNRRRYVMRGGLRICPSCRKEIMRKAKQMKLSIGIIVRTPLLDDMPCELCNRQ